MRCSFSLNEKCNFSHCMINSINTKPLSKSKSKISYIAPFHLYEWKNPWKIWGKSRATEWIMDLLMSGQENLPWRNNGQTANPIVMKTKTEPNKFLQQDNFSKIFKNKFTFLFFNYNIELKWWFLPPVNTPDKITYKDPTPPFNIVGLVSYFRALQELFRVSFKERKLPSPPFVSHCFRGSRLIKLYPHELVRP